ncbi:ABC transporter permease [Companilactobacillus metriopterae]|uniref:ABC transporter permease n=1 Tax=Companilactobacillus metriopterae TaxID=1909267 RepID=UPI00100BE532|nr:ABC transporter permease [Companilactobacillus metriopterae]
MTDFIYQTKINFLRLALRNKSFFIYDVIFPAFFYLLYTKILPVNQSGPLTEEWNKEYLISMLIFSATLISITTFSNFILSDKQNKFELFVKLSPISKIQYYASVIVVLIAMKLISFLLIGLVGGLVNSIHISAGTWINLILVFVIGTIPFDILGLLISQSGNINLVNVLNNIGVFLLAILGGLWWPLRMFPEWLQHIGKLTPVYQLSNIMKSVVLNSSFHVTDIIGLSCWTVAFLVAMYLINLKKE